MGGVVWGTGTYQTQSHRRTAVSRPRRSTHHPLLAEAVGCRRAWVTGTGRAAGPGRGGCLPELLLLVFSSTAGPATPGRGAAA